MNDFDEWARVAVGQQRVASSPPVVGHDPAPIPEEHAATDPDLDEYVAIGAVVPCRLKRDLVGTAEHARAAKKAKRDAEENIKLRAKHASRDAVLSVAAYVFGNSIVERSSEASGLSEQQKALCDMHLACRLIFRGDCNPAQRGQQFLAFDRIARVGSCLQKERIERVLDNSSDSSASASTSLRLPAQSQHSRTGLLYNG